MTTRSPRPMPKRLAAHWRSGTLLRAVPVGQLAHVAGLALEHDGDLVGRGRASARSRQLCDTFNWPSANQRKLGARDSSSGSVKGRCQSISAWARSAQKPDVVLGRLSVHRRQFGGLEHGRSLERLAGGNTRSSCRTDWMFFCAIVTPRASNSGGDAAHLLPQNVAESMGVEKGIEPRRDSAASASNHPASPRSACRRRCRSSGGQDKRLPCAPVVWQRRPRRRAASAMEFDEDSHTIHRASRTRANSSAAVFLPTPGTPGILSTLSPVSAKKSAMSSGAAPKRGPMS